MPAYKAVVCSTLKCNLWIFELAHQLVLPLRTFAPISSFLRFSVFKLRTHTEQKVKRTERRTPDPYCELSFRTAKQLAKYLFFCDSALKYEIMMAELTANQRSRYTGVHEYSTFVGATTETVDITCGWEQAAWRYQLWMTSSTLPWPRDRCYCFRWL